jgi:hypothetical protein
LSTPVVLLLKGLAGGTFVVLFALIGSTVRPKRFAGLFSAAPSVATASLLIAAYSAGVREIKPDAQALIVGAVAMVAAALLGLPLLGRLSALRTTFCITGFWVGVAALGYAVVLR